MYLINLVSFSFSSFPSPLLSFSSFPLLLPQVLVLHHSPETADKSVVLLHRDLAQQGPKDVGDGARDGEQYGGGRAAIAAEQDAGPRFGSGGVHERADGDAEEGNALHTRRDGREHLRHGPRRVERRNDLVLLRRAAA